MEKLKWLFYLIAFMLISIPTSIVLMDDDVTFSSTFSNTVISTAIVLVILGKLINVYKKRKENKSFVSDIGIIIGITIVLITNFV
jgi:predicted tellurium resistance membrane protein TerC